MVVVPASGVHLTRVASTQGLLLTSSHAAKLSGTDGPAAAVGAGVPPGVVSGPLASVVLGYLDFEVLHPARGYRSVEAHYGCLGLVFRVETARFAEDMRVRGELAK